MDQIIKALQSIFGKSTTAYGGGLNEDQYNALMRYRQQAGKEGQNYIASKMGGKSDMAYELSLYNRAATDKQKVGQYPWEYMKALQSPTPSEYPVTVESAQPQANPTPYPIPDNYMPIIAQAAKQNGVPPEVVAAVLARESAGFQDKYVSGYHTDGTGRGIAGIDKKWHPEVSDEQAFDPKFAIDWMTKYLKQQEDAAGGDIYTGLRRYNGGAGYGRNDPGYGGVPVSKRTKTYADDVTRNSEEYKRLFRAKK